LEALWALDTTSYELLRRDLGPFRRLACRLVTIEPEPAARAQYPVCCVRLAVRSRYFASFLRNDAQERGCSDEPPLSQQ
jgi:hypothetical protein